MSLMMDMTGCVLLFSEMAPFEMTMSTSRILSVLFDDETLEEVPNVPGVSASVNMCICAHSCLTGPTQQFCSGFLGFQSPHCPSVVM